MFYIILNLINFYNRFKKKNGIPQNQHIKCFFLSIVYTADQYAVTSV